MCGGNEMGHVGRKKWAVRLVRDLCETCARLVRDLRETCARLGRDSCETRARLACQLTRRKVRISGRGHVSVVGIESRWRDGTYEHGAEGHGHLDEEIRF